MPIDQFNIAAIQMVSTEQVSVNLEKVEELVIVAINQGAQMVVLPENFVMMAPHRSLILAAAEKENDGLVQTFLGHLAKKYSIWLVAGSLAIQSDVENKVYAACLVYDSNGYQVARYNKLHLYDVDLPEAKERYRESDTFMSGSDLVVVETPFGKMGLSICYDLRFPELYRQLMLMGAEFIVAPSAFTEKTGKKHWSLLCRARAVENSCYLIAPNQGGLHTNGRQTYGHSLVVDPWGEILVEAGKGACVVLATLKKSRLKQIRKTFPAINHTRFSFNLMRE